MRLSELQIDRIAHRIDERRVALGLSFAELGRKARVHGSQVSRICRKDFRTLSSNVVQICSALDIQVEEVASPQQRSGWERLEHSLRSAWDQTAEGAERLARVIEAVGDATRR